MKKKQLIINLSLAVTVLFLILFQSLHTYGHFVKEFFQTECHHKDNGNTAQITHKHHSFDTCKVCHLTFGSYVSPRVFAYSLHSNYKQIPYFFETGTSCTSFSGSLYSLRGPPSVII